MVLLCGCGPLPDICRPKWFPDPFFVWKWCTQCSQYSRNCARVFRICSCRIRTSSQTPLLEDPTDSPEISQLPSSRPVASTSYVSNRIDYSAATTTIEGIPQLRQSELRVFKFDESQFNSSSGSAESSDDDEHPKERRSIRKGHPLIPWELLELHKTVRPWGSDPSTINKAFDYMIKRLNTGNRRVTCNTVPVHGQLDLSRKGLENHFDSKEACEKRTPPKTNINQDTSGSSAAGHEDLDSLKMKTFANDSGSDSNDTRGFWKKPISPKTLKLDTSEDSAPGQKGPVRQEPEQFLDPSNSKGICTAMVKSVSPKTPLKLETSESSAIGIRRDLQ